MDINVAVMRDTGTVVVLLCLILVLLSCYCCATLGLSGKVNIGRFPFPASPVLLRPPTSDREGCIGFTAVASDTITLFRSFGLGYGVGYVAGGRWWWYSEVGRERQGHEAG